MPKGGVMEAPRAGDTAPLCGCGEPTCRGCGIVDDVHVVFADAHETSLSKLSEADWQRVHNTWARGIDWVVGKAGKKWEITLFAGFPLYSTKREAYNYATNLIIAESRWRSYQRVLAAENAQRGDPTLVGDAR